ncbi:MAG: LuxR C-terminal-related transcriptional regulator [Anaerolineales bacterium]
MVPRPRLIDWLKQRQARPLTLVSAPAGYGKSTLISCWLEEADCPVAWVSLDERDNELSIFLNYFLAAIQSVFPEAMAETQALLLVAPVTPVATISKELINEINQIQQAFILVLDDYHLIDLQVIHDLLSELLLHPPANLHLVLGTRMDPPLPLVKLRANSLLTEVRIQSLRFQPQETLQLFQKMIGDHVDPAVVSAAEAEAEGWVTGLRLAALAMRHRIGRESVKGNLTLHNRYVTEYLLNEIMANQAAMMSDCLLRTSILERFCADLSQAVCSASFEPGENGSARPQLSGEQFLEWLRASNLFVIPLDDNQQWYRYHHLFRDFLQRELARRYGHEGISELHAAAGRWYAHNGWIEEALFHLLAAGDYPAAIGLVAQHRYALMNATQWPQLERWLDLFPFDIIQTSAELWMLKTWLAYHRGQLAELGTMLQPLLGLSNSGTGQNISTALQGEINTLRSLITYHDNNNDASLKYAQTALEQLPDKLWIVRILARVYLAGNLLVHADTGGANQALYGALAEEKEQSKHFKATLLMGACSLHWVAADLQSMAQAARLSIELSRETGRQQVLDFSSYQLARVYYQHNDLSAAEKLFAGAVTRPYLNYGESYVNSACGLALTYQTQDKPAEARAIAEAAVTFLLETGNINQLPLVQALQAELALKQGNLPAASQWAEQFGTNPPLKPIYEFFSPHLTLVKIWLAQDTSASRDKAAGLLKTLQEYLESKHNTRFLIETLAMQALLQQARGAQPAALSALKQALRLAQPGGFIRLFVDTGDQMQILLSHLLTDETLGAYCAQILAAFPETQPKPGISRSQALEEPLTSRELDILELLRDRLTNKEIAKRLVISPGTVKGHTINIYQKLAVNNRRQAVEKALALGILSER